MNEYLMTQFKYEYNKNININNNNNNIKLRKFQKKLVDLLYNYNIEIVVKLYHTLKKIGSIIKYHHSVKYKLA